jgi:hypothetical protein
LAPASRARLRSSIDSLEYRWSVSPAVCAEARRQSTGIDSATATTRDKHHPIIRFFIMIPFYVPA